MKKDGLGQAWFISILFVVAGMGLLIWSAKTLVPYMQPSKDLYESNFEDIKLHSKVNGEAFAVLDYCAEKERYTTTMGIKTGTIDVSRYYIIPVYKGSDDNEYFVILQVSGDKLSDYDKLIDATYDYISGDTEDISYDPIPFEGILDKASNEIYGYAKSWFITTGYYSSSSEVDAHLLPYCINTTSADKIALFVLPVLGLAALVLGIYFLAALIGTKRPKKLQRTTVLIKEKEFPIHEFDNVDKLLRNDKRAAAVIELSKIVGISFEEAVEIVDKWDSYYC